MFNPFRSAALRFALAKALRFPQLHGV